LSALASFSLRLDTPDLGAVLDREEPLPHRSEGHCEIVAGHNWTLIP
jgi:hypothetical protein